MSKFEELKLKLISISQSKDFTILSDLTGKLLQTIKLDVKCNKCGNETHPTISEFQKPRYQERPCRCEVWKKKKEAVQVQNTSEWKFIHTIEHPLSSKYEFASIQPFYRISLTGQVQNMINNNILNSPSISTENDRAILRTIKGKNTYKTIPIDILVGCAFLPIPEGDPELLFIEHMDEDKKNNHKNNLSWQLSSDDESKPSPGKLWIKGKNVYFTEADFNLYCKNKTGATIHSYNNTHDRLAIEHSVEFTDEIWRYRNEGYFVSSCGRVFLTRLNKRTFGEITQEGYMKFQNTLLHRLILNPQDPSKYQLVRHKDGRKCNNNLSNLEWVSDLVEAEFKYKLKVSQHDTDGKEIAKSQTLFEAINTLGLEYTEACHLYRGLSKDNEYEAYGYTWKITQFEERHTIEGSDLIDLSKHKTDKGIKISQKDFTLLKNLPNIVPSIMHLLSDYTEPILPIIPQDTLPTHYSRIDKDDTKIVTDDDGTLSITANNQGRPLLSYFMYPGMIRGHPKSKPSYVDCWHDLKLREKLVKRMIAKDLTVSNGSLYGCYACQYGRLYNFPPNVARCLYNHFNAKRILDFCAGFGGRLLGFWTSNAVEYIGIDPNTDNPYTDLIKCLGTFKDKKCRIINQCAEDTDYSNLGTFDMIFTSPPYFDTEIYSHAPTQSCNRHPAFCSWLNDFLFKTIEKVVLVLNEGGILAINIKDHKKYKIIDPMIEYIRSLGLHEQTHIRLGQAKRHRSNTKYESIYIFKKLPR